MNVTMDTMLDKQEFEMFKQWFNNTIGTDWEVSYTQECPKQLKPKYGDLVQVSMFDITNSEFKMIQDWEDKNLTNKDVMIDLFETCYYMEV